MATSMSKQPAWQQPYLNPTYQPATPLPPKPSFQVGSMPQPQYKPPEGMQEAMKSFQPSLYGQPAAKPATTTLQPYMNQPQALPTNAVAATPKPTDGLEPWMKAYTDYLTKPVTPFTYDPQNDPAYQSQKAIIGEDLRKGMANARVEAGASGLRGGSLQNNQLLQLTQQSESRLQNEIIPELKSQAWTEYQGAINQDRNKMSDTMNYVTTKYGMNKDEETSQRNARLDRRQTQQDHLDLADKVSKDYGIHIDPKDDPALVYEQVKGLKTLAQQKQEAEGQVAIRKQAQEQFETIGRVTAELSPILGLPEGTTTQQAAYQNATLKNTQANTDIDNTLARDKFNKEYDPNTLDNQAKSQQILKAKAELEQLGKSKPITLQDAQSVLLKTPFITEESTTDAFGKVTKTGNVKVDKPNLVRAIAGLGVDDAMMDALFGLNGISEKEIQEIEKQLRAERGN